MVMSIFTRGKKTTKVPKSRNSLLLLPCLPGMLRWIKECQVYVFLSELQPGQGDVGGNGKSEEGADSQEHCVGVDKGEQEDADGREDKGAVHNKEGVDKGKVRQPP